MSAVYKFPYNTPLRYLPLVYMLPHDLFIHYPILRKLPRSIGALNASPEWAEVMQSDAFLNEAIDAVASLAFPHVSRRRGAAPGRTAPCSWTR